MSNPHPKPSPGRKKKHAQPVKMTISVDKALKDEFLSKFKGKASEMIAYFMQESNKMLPRMVFEMKYYDIEDKSERAQYPGKNVLQLDKDNPKKVIQAFISVREAGRATGVSYTAIAQVCRKVKGHYTAGGFKWKYI